MRGVHSPLLLLPLLILTPSGTAGESDDLIRLSAQVSAERLVESVRDLSRFEGRQSGTPGGEAAAAYLASRLPQADFQPFSVKTIQIRTPIHASILTDQSSKTLRNGRDFIPVLNAAAATLTSAPVVFVGYGVADPARGLDEYTGLSVTGKVVLFLRGQPKRYTGRVTHTEKVRTARAKGAIAYLTVTGPVLSQYEQRRGMSQRPMSHYEGTMEEALPGLWIAPDVAEAILKPSGVTLESFQKEEDQALAPHSFETKSAITLDLKPRQFDATAINVMAVWPGSDPALRNEVVIIGAHYDHFGTQAGLLFPGADDNASGTAILLEIAGAFTSTGLKPRRTIVFLAFAGEEQGLLGSRFYVSDPARPLAATKAMINVDHAGVGNGKITVGLSGLEKASAQAAAVKVGLGEQIELFGQFPGGDHVPFAEAGVPTAAIVSSGPHPDFHQPTDTPEKIRPEILGSIARYTLSLLWTLANDEK